MEFPLKVGCFVYLKGLLIYPPKYKTSRVNLHSVLDLPVVTWKYSLWVNCLITFIKFLFKCCWLLIQSINTSRNIYFFPHLNQLNKCLKIFPPTAYAFSECLHYMITIVKNKMLFKVLIHIKRSTILIV